MYIYIYIQICIPGPLAGTRAGALAGTRAWSKAGTWARGIEWVRR